MNEPNRLIKRAALHSSSVNPTSIVTCQWSIFPSSMWPRVSVISNQRMLRMVFEALAMAVFTASSMLSGDEPTNSIFL